MVLKQKNKRKQETERGTIGTILGPLKLAIEPEEKLVCAQTLFWWTSP